MDIHSNLEYLCRVCAANTKGKNSVAECVYILKTAGLKDKLDKFLYLKISENDSLPKVLCKSCFRQVEATASLSKIAKHTQQVFRDFLLSNLPKGPSKSTNTTEFTSSDFTGNKDVNNKSKNDETAVPTILASSLVQLPPPLTPAASILPPQLLQPSPTLSRKDEVVVNVSVADPLTRDNQQKMISNSQRRQSLLLDSRYTPKSIAQKPATTTACLRLIAPKPNQPIETENATNNQKNSAPPINFYPVTTQHPPQPTQITTFSSGGYVIGRINESANDKEETVNRTLPLATAADNILQQKRKNLVKALNNIKANSSGQVSLLKSSQQKQAEAMVNNIKAPLTEVVNQTAEDELPEKIIIAAPKNKPLKEKSKREPLNLSSKLPLSVTQHTLSAPTAINTAVVQHQQEQSNNYPVTPPKPAFPEDILLGRVIRDMDLLKLILKALKWPVNKQNMELQLQRLRNSKFTDIMSDPNLLQDTDLTQLLGPYLAPVLLAAQALQQQQQHQQQQHQQQQQQQILRNATLNQHVPETFKSQPKMTALEVAQAEINKSIPYKLPPETSVQLVPATPEETEPDQSPPLINMNTSSTTSIAGKRDGQKEAKTVAVPQKRQRRAAIKKTRDSIIISDEEEASNEEEAPKKSRPRASKSSSNIQIELSPNLMSQFNILNGSGSTEADELMALLLKQKSALIKDKQRRRRNSVCNMVTLPPSEFDALIDLDDDIVLMEPVSTTTSSETGFSNQVLQLQKSDDSNTFVIPSVPLITRPIIKRRKTVIHSPKNRFNLSIELKNKDQTISSSSALQNKERLLEETINQVATGNITTAETTSSPQTINNEISSFISAELTPKKASQQKKIQNKSALGQQLLEAIGLQKISPKTTSNAQTEAARSSKLSSAITAVPNSKQSIQQIRSALKKSLKLAQEQQQQKKKDLKSSFNNTIIQDADSTTKPAVKEIVVVEGNGNKNDNCCSMVDVEEQIKVTLMVRKNDDESCEQSATKTTTSEKDEKKEVKKSASDKIQERRRTMLATGTNGMEDKEKSKEGQPEKISENIEATDENEKSLKEESGNIISSSVSHTNISNEAAITTNDEVVTPKRRGRKRLADKQTEVEVSNEKSQTLSKSSEVEIETTRYDKNEEETEINKTSGRPTRQSKTQSKYYKGPEELTQSRRSLPSRTTRNR